MGKGREGGSVSCRVLLMAGPYHPCSVLISMSKWPLYGPGQRGSDRACKAGLEKQRAAINKTVRCSRVQYCKTRINMTRNRLGLMRCKALFDPMHECVGACTYKCTCAWNWRRMGKRKMSEEGGVVAAGVRHPSPLQLVCVLGFAADDS